MSFRALRARTALATAVGLAAALMAPTSSGAAAPAAASDTIDITGTVVMLAGEEGQPDRYSVLLPSGRALELADGFTAEPLSHFSGSVAVPGAGSGRTLTGSARAGTLRRATSARTRVKVVSARVAPPGPAPAATNHVTYVAKVTNFGAIALTDAQILANIDATQAYWVRESGGQIPSWTRTPTVAAVASGAGSAANGCGLGNGGVDFAAITQSVGSQAYPGVDFSGLSPNHLVVVVPNGCGGTEASGRARVGSSFASGGPAIIDARPLPLPTLDHELGHNLGLQHANTTIEYGNNYEVMGAGPDTFTSPVLGTVYRWEQGIIGSGETVDGTAGGSWLLAPRSSAAGLRSVVFIDPDNGRRTFVDFRDASAGDAGTCYAASCNLTTTYGQSYAPGITVARENDKSGAVLLSAAGNNGSLQVNETWSNQSGSLVVRAVTANTAQVVRTAVPALPAGSAAIAGTAKGLTKVTATGAVTGASAYRYQWLLNGQPIISAEESTFTPTLDMVGGALSVQVTGFAVGRLPSAATSAAQTVAPATLYYRTGTKATATVSGRTRVGEVLTVAGLDWVSDLGTTPAGLTLSYQWLRNGKLIKGANKSTYRLTFRDLKKRIQAKELPSAPGFQTDAQSRSFTTSKVRTGKLMSPRPSIGGKAKVGKRVKARTSGWTRATKFRYQWFVGKRAVRGATGKKLRITRSMKGKKIAVKVTGRKKGFKAASAKSKSRKVK